MNTLAETTIEADPRVPAIRMTRDFAATREQLFRAHTDPKLFAQFEGAPDGVALESPREDLGDGCTGLHAQSLVDSFEGRDARLSSGMELGVNEGYAKLDGMLADGIV